MDLNQELGDTRIISELGARLRKYRLQQNLTVRETATRAGISSLTLLNAERGSNFTILTLIRVLRALGRLDQLDSFLPEPSLSPLALLELERRPQKRRARRQRE